MYLLYLGSTSESLRGPTSETENAYKDQVERTRLFGEILHDISWAVWMERMGNQRCFV